MPANPRAATTGPTILIGGPTSTATGSSIIPTVDHCFEGDCPTVVQFSALTSRPSKVQEAAQAVRPQCPGVYGDMVDLDFSR
jgi:hypothetical protein